MLLKYVSILAIGAIIVSLGRNEAVFNVDSLLDLIAVQII